MTESKSFANRLELWSAAASVPVYLTVWFLACRGEGLVLNLHAAICALSYTTGYVLALRRGYLALSVDGIAVPLLALGCAISLILFNFLDLWPLDMRQSILFVLKGMGIAYFLAHVAGSVVYVCLGTLLEKIFKQRIEAESLKTRTEPVPETSDTRGN